MSLYIVDIHGEIEGDYEIIGKVEEPKGLMIAEKFEALTNEYTHLMIKYQMMKADYENRLKNDLVAMVLEIQTEIDEIPRYRSLEEYASDVDKVIQKIIDGLREESEEKDDK